MLPPSPESPVRRDAPRRQPPPLHWLRRGPAAGAGGSATGGQRRDGAADCGGAVPAAVPAAAGAAGGVHGRGQGAGGRGADAGADAGAGARSWWC